MTLKAFMYNPKLVRVVEVFILMEEGRRREILGAFPREVVVPEPGSIEVYLKSGNFLVVI